MKKLAIIGASYLQFPLVQKANEMGIETYCFAWEDGSVCKDIADFFYPVSIIDKETILEICKKINIDGIISIASDAAVPTVCYVAENMGLISNSIESSLFSTNKYMMRNRFVEKGIVSPRFLLAENGISYTNLNYPLIVKPTDRSGSRGVEKVEKPEYLENAIERAQKESFTNQAIVEEFISGSEVSVETVSWQGKHYILAITDKVTTGEPYFVELEHHQPSQLPDEIQSKIKDITVKALDSLDIKFGAGHTELKITRTGDINVIEVGARMGGDFIGSDLVQLSTGYDFLKGVIDISLGDFEEPVISEYNYSGVYFLCEETKHLLSVIENIEADKNIIKSEITDAKLKNIQCSADRSGYFIYRSENKIVP
ncbi:MAG: ATP-grasp domain-containing protein [Bacteroidales bacterium]|jgi:biotin carboxylase|nr:ATP-grasp domain-containing protein [Bacteroidales bacterium]